MKKLLAFMLMFVFAVALVGCQNGNPEITITGGTSVEVGKTLQLKAEVKGSKNKEVVWSSAKDTVASVNQDGLVTGISNGNTVIKATLKSNDKIVGSVLVRVTGSSGTVYPDLGGYTIKIAQAGHALYETDPFHDDYKGLDKEAKQRAWDFVEEHFNVKIEVVPYSDDAEWGEPRWTYIEQQAAAGKADYDFYTVPDSKIGRFVEANAILDTTNWYALYGQGFLDEVYKQSGSYKNKIYTITAGTSSIYNVMYYNIGLLESLGMEKTPAQLFNEGEWTYTKFKEYAIEAQAKLNSIAATKGVEYYAVAGNSAYYWAGMTNAGGVKIADVSTFQMNVKDPIANAAATTLKEIKANGAMDPARQVDAGVTSWMDGRALFCSGDLWFVRTSNRWKENLWGDNTKYGYVPFPRPDEMAKEDQKIGLGGTATWVMPVGRDYSGYTKDVTAENIYWAMVTTFLKTEEFYTSSPNYDKDVLLKTNAERYTDSPDSVDAFVWMSKNVETNGFYDPMSIPDNPICNLGSGHAFAHAINDYVMGKIATYADAVDPHIATLQEALYKAFS